MTGCGGAVAPDVFGPWEKEARDVLPAAELREFNGERDHVHLLIHYPPQVKLSTLGVGTVKSFLMSRRGLADAWIVAAGVSRDVLVSDPRTRVRA